MRSYHSSTETQVSIGRMFLSHLASISSFYQKAWPFHNHEQLFLHVWNGQAFWMLKCAPDVRSRSNSFLFEGENRTLFRRRQREAFSYIFPLFHFFHLLRIIKKHFHDKTFYFVVVVVDVVVGKSSLPVWQQLELNHREFRVENSLFRLKGILKKEREKENLTFI